MALLDVSKPIQERFFELRDKMIIGMGPQVVPLILAELEKETDHWFWALAAITGENPVDKQEAGDIEASARAWIRWGKKNGLLAK